MIFIGANDGMIHAIDARTGYEMWAFIPYNLLPKLRTFRDGQAVDQFDYFVDSSPKIAEVKLSGVWRTLLLIGEGPGGTFYQTFDVTEAGMGVDPALDSCTPGFTGILTSGSSFLTNRRSSMPLPIKIPRKNMITEATVNAAPSKTICPRLK